MYPNTRSLLITVFATTSIMGCKNETEPKPVANEQKTQAPMQPLVKKVELIDWCPEHGVPESICTRCSASPEPFKQKGDWCSKHDLPDSQCFICHPELKAQFAAQYKEKYGKEPPPMTPEAATQ